MQYRLAVGTGCVTIVPMEFLRKCKTMIIIIFYRFIFIVILFREGTPYCPRVDCGEELTAEEGRPVCLLIKWLLKLVIIVLFLSVLS